MKLRTILAGTALATLALTAAPQLGVTGVATQAQAAVDVSIGIFYDRLAPHGDWVSYRDQYVFIPARVDAGWRPYTRGHWVYTERFGWTWASDEPFGWATYHYGRWGYAEDIGWYWVPGRKWAPAWVSWRRSKNYVAWAPLPPSRGGVDISINITVGDVPDYYWVAVPTRRFLAPDLRVVIVDDDREMREVVRYSEFIGTPRITNNIVVNNVIDVDVIAKATGETVKTVEVQTTDNPAEAKAGADQVTVFQGELAADTKVKPQKLSDVTKVKKVKRNQAGTDAAPAAGDNAGVPAEQPASDAAATPPVTGTDKKKVGTDTTTPPDNASGQANAPATTGELPSQAQENSQSGTKANDNAAAPATSGELPAQAQDKSQKKKKQGDDTEESTGSTSTAPSQSGSDDANGASTPDQNANAPAEKGNKGKGKKDQACDPETDANCAPAQ